VLARRYRPMQFEQVVGQGHVTRTLQNAIGAGRVHHAYLFTGSRGVGKTTVARIMAKALNCDPGSTAHPCDSCLSCTEIPQGRSVDVFERPHRYHFGTHGAVRRASVHDSSAQATGSIALHPLSEEPGSDDLPLALEARGGRQGRVADVADPRLRHGVEVRLRRFRCRQ